MIRCLRVTDFSLCLFIVDTKTESRPVGSGVKPRMKKYKNLIIGLAFLIIALAALLLVKPVNFFFPTQEVELSGNANFGNLLPGVLFIQEVTMKKEYLEEVEVYLGKTNETAIQSNTLLLSNETGTVFYSKRFTSEEIVKADYYPFKLKKPVRAGVGKKVFVCLASFDGNPSNCLSIPLNTTSKFGKFVVARIQNDDIPATIANPREVSPMEGSIGIRTHETNAAFLNGPAIVVCIIILLLTITIILSTQILRLLRSFTVKPEYFFVGTAAVFGLIFLFITPPFQTPDEPAHFYRAYEISELNLSRMSDEVPVAVKQTATACERMKFKSWEKFSQKDMAALKSIQLDSRQRTYVESVNYTLPYLPQALGISIGKLFSNVPVIYLYWARFFNLITAIFLIFLAIRITPVQKWIFALLGVMPMTVSQMASVSYDAPTIGLSLLLIALILKFTFTGNERLITKSIVTLFILTLLLACTKPPYFLISMAFLIVPVLKAGSMKKYLLIAAGLLVTGVLVSQFSTQVVTGIRSLLVQETRAAVAVPSIPASPGPAVTATPAGVSAAQVQDAPGKAGLPRDPADTNKNPAVQTGTAQEKVSTAQDPGAVVSDRSARNLYNAREQKDFILRNPARYLEILITTVVKFSGLYLTSFVGLFGWNDTGLPGFMVFLYLLLLFVALLVDRNGSIRIRWSQKLILFAIFLVCLTIIETGLYLYSNLVGAKYIIGVQGRYFIPMAPLLLLMFYTAGPAGFLNRMFSKTDPGSRKAKKPVKKTVTRESLDLSRFQTYYLPWFLLPVVLFELIYALIMVINRFYIVLV